MDRKKTVNAQIPLPSIHAFKVQTAIAMQYIHTRIYLHHHTPSCDIIEMLPTVDSEGKKWLAKLVYLSVATSILDMKRSYGES